MWSSWSRRVVGGRIATAAAMSAGRWQPKQPQPQPPTSPHPHHHLLHHCRRLHQSYSRRFATDDNPARAVTALPLRCTKKKSALTSAKHLVDEKTVRVVGGRGGNGRVSFMKLFGNENAGPDGGDGGNGGHVVFRASENVTGLAHLVVEIRADDGEKGYNKDCHGKGAEHRFVDVPVGTVIKDSDGRVVGDLARPGVMFVAARGGAGGHGNRYFATDTEQAPEVAEVGGAGESLRYTLELSSIADFGLLGFPNAGKSTLLRAITRARPKVAPYPFTTLQPYVGVVRYSDMETIAVADLPGLIEDSHRNHGLGISFLRHVQRCMALMLVVDLSLPEPWSYVHTLRNEVRCFSETILARPQLIVANKIDADGAADNLVALRERLPDDTIIEISAKHGVNLERLLVHMKSMYDQRVGGESPADEHD
ncbi:GTP-binding protein Obg/CgtA,OBG-type guanine nucleotide-binding (G) domain,GTP binding domain,P-loop [Cinara cedri]|uniref:GTP-binding protein Obg/CgtA,OBG-type guanine nucleotide-binding (G) domain,GTP binding domain,P-loop n=1 Tax=Cinara cedri TaxID=506608 RepID=A0A5E4NE80_9HEMI|nr:GTP-binding protein Obg/CgtA,OBG-type guanine nucleotide-binding (G) domain,GTP binding domain,P-loop [Cinara cedri]